tara:strand:+ start:1216 stop:1497 length:282 start_codon:yes stop_codon:yes gene_type:complete
MVLPISNIQNVLRTYGRQLNIARLNVEKKQPVVQGQVDRVEISEEAKRLLEQKPQTTAPDTKIPVRETFDEFETETVEKSDTFEPVEDDDFNF